MPNRGTMGKLLEPRSELEFDWRIPNFNSLRSEPDDYYDSPVFQFSDSLWYFQIHPTGVDSNGGRITLFLKKHDKGRPKTVSYSLAIKTKISPGEYGKKWRRGETYENGGSSRSCHLLKRSELLEWRSTLLPCGVLTIRCFLKADERKEDSVTPQAMKLTELDSLSVDLGNLLDRGSNCDVTLHVQNQEFRAHRSILTARSEVLASMFEHEMSESKTGVVNIVDCDPDFFADFLRYLYTGKIEEMTEDKVFDLYKTADKYAVLKLKSLCVEFMARNLSADNLCAVATLAQRQGEDALLASVQDFFNDNLASVFSTHSWDILVSEDYNLAKRLLKQMASKVRVGD